jgi:hypothetical protein
MYTCILIDSCILPPPLLFLSLAFKWCVASATTQAFRSNFCVSHIYLQVRARSSLIIAKLE